MSPAVRFSGLPVSAGVATGRLHVADLADSAGATADEVRDAFAAVAAERSALAERLRRAGRDEEAAIIGVGALIATDAALVGPAVAAVRGGADAVTAVRQASEAQAAVIGALPTAELAERAGDVRQIARAVLDHLSSGAAAARPAGDFILVRREVGPADLIELAEEGLAGAVSLAGGASSHAAIVARGLGVPMVTGVDAAVLAMPAGQQAILDASAGELIVGPGAAELAAAAGNATAAGNGAGPLRARPGGPARTADGREITVLCNVASVAETRRGLAAGAGGVGLLRTEIPYTGALAWPTLAEHRAQLAPILALLEGRPATVRLLDFSGDKIPPFLGGATSPGSATSPGGATSPARTFPASVTSPGGATSPGSGGTSQPAASLAALLTHRTALPDQLRALLETGRRTQLSVLIPMVSSLDEVLGVRDVLSRTAAALGANLPRLGIMVELQSTAAAAGTFAAAVDFFSIGTNDLTCQVLGLDRRDPAATPALAAHPQVLALIAHVTDVGRQAGIGVSVCGDSAADPLVLPLLVGLGVDTLSVPAARVPQVGSLLAELDYPACAALAAEALRASTADEVRKLVLAR
ncbi:MAG TPA: putative PEP-binding protein [Streptosporangiaceae bacterium]|nr:putative PEP-binding protein [Streptosporangiaceae bacterium]